jgi:hypothetical protein
VQAHAAAWAAIGGVRARVEQNVESFASVVGVAVARKPVGVEARHGNIASQPRRTVPGCGFEARRGEALQRRRRQQSADRECRPARPRYT